MRFLFFICFACFYFPGLQAQMDKPGKCYVVRKAYSGSAIDGYNLYIPNSSLKAKKPYPLIVFLQGGLAVGGDVNAVFKWELPKELLNVKKIESELDELKFNTFIYVMPHLKYGQFYQNEEAIQQIIAEVSQKHNVDPQRVYLTGLSRGGHGTWGLASRIPEEFAAIAPVCGNDKGIKYYQWLQDLPIWVTHNTADPDVPYNESTWIVQQIEKQSGRKFHRTQTVNAADIQQDLIFTSPRRQSHNAWSALYNSPQFYQWLLHFRRE